MNTRQKPKKIEAKKSSVPRAILTWQDILHAVPILGCYVFFLIVTNWLDVEEKFGHRVGSGISLMLTLVFYFGGWIILDKIRHGNNR